MSLYIRTIFQNISVRFKRVILQENLLKRAERKSRKIMAAEPPASANEYELCTSPPRKTGKSHPQIEVLKEETVASGKWLSLQTLTYRDPLGKQREWEAVSRTTRQEGSNMDAVVVIAILKRLLKYDCVVLVKQFRPPMKGYTIEFPAGLIDAGEKMEAAAVRELQEETGYTATIKHCSPATCLDPGLSNCTVTLVSAEIDGDASDNKDPQSNPDPSEFIEVLTVPVNDMLERLNVYSSDGMIIDARVYTYAVAQAQAKKEHKLEEWIGLNKS